MSKKNIILLILIVVLIGFGTYITLLYFNINSSNSSDNIVNYSDEVYTIENLPIDNDYTDNLKLYGGWESEKIEVYRDNELSSTIMDNSGVLQIYNNDKMEICYIDDNDELVCITGNYSFKDNILYVVSNDTYLSGKRNIIFKDNYLILKKYINNSLDNYSMLYFIKNNV